MSFQLSCPVDAAPLREQSDSRELACGECGARYPVEDGVVRFLPDADAFYEGRYLYTVRFVPRSEHLWHAWPVWLMNAGYPWAVRRFVPAGARVLEMGCASGVAYFAQRYRVLGLDLSQGSLRRVAELYDTCIQADVTERIPLPDGCLDAVISSFVWEHIPPERKPAALRELHRVLRPGGSLVFLFDVESRNPILRLLERRDPALYQEVLIDREGHAGWQTPEENRELFRAGGFEVLAYEGKDKLLMAPAMFDKVREFGGALRLIGAAGFWLSKGRRFHLVNALLRILDETVGRALPTTWSRVIVAACEKVDAAPDASRREAAA